jgi:cyclopropane fatty-acyl-phospholipid synthase-like methyltransferase
MNDSDLPYSQACENNKAAILSVLQLAFASCQQVLEIGSGTGQHAVHFAKALPHLIWQTSDQRQYLCDITRRIQRAELVNLPAPLLFDVTKPLIVAQRYDAIFSANTLHIMPWPVVGQLFARLPQLTTKGAAFCLYGPFKYAGQFTSDSNASFDLSLKQRDPAMGIRDIEAVQTLAKHHGFTLLHDIAMPANNQLLWFKTR